MNKSEVRSYLSATRGVEGWFFPIDAYLFAMIDAIQKSEGIAGNLFEIGVHHGKTAIFLARMARPGEILGVCDVFEQQDLNRDQSGEGSRELFLRHLRAASALAEERVVVHAKDSATLTPDDTTRDVRFFHVDGGHRPQDVMADLETASRALRPDGVVAVDDVFNPSWPGVGEGTLRFLERRPGVFVPIAIGGNKAYFTRPDAASRYEQHWGDLARMNDFYDGGAFGFEWKQWFGRTVVTAARRTWVDLDPIAAARAHLGDDPARGPVTAFILDAIR